MTSTIVAVPENIEDQFCKTEYRGISARFVPIDDKWGIKAYQSERKRDMAYRKQKQYAELGFAPPVGDIFRIGYWYCYATRIAIPMVHPNMPIMQKFRIFNACKQEREDRLQEMWDEGLNPHDTHRGNWGYYEDELVLIDLGMDGGYGYDSYSSL